METQKPLFKDEDGEEVDVYMYRSMIGSLMYLTSSRPDIMFIVCACARYQVNPQVSHLHAVKRILRYLKGQPKLGLWYPKDSPFDLVAYTNSDYVGASLDRKYTTRDGKEIVITESSVRRDLQLADEEGIDCLPNSTIFEQLALMGRLKKLEKRNRSRTHKLKRLYKVGLTARVESSGDEEILGEDASKQERRIDSIDAYKDITLVNDADNKMFDVDDLGGEEVFVERQNENVDEEVVDAAQIYTLVEKKYPLTPSILSVMLEKKLQIDYESEMAYQLCKLIKKQLKKYRNVWKHPPSVDEALNEET
nr:uncharacterized mitochondrial protein AtMg00810-like [Tanacetum cinerariifolium]